MFIKALRARREISNTHVCVNRCTRLSVELYYAIDNVNIAPIRILCDITDMEQADNSLQSLV